MTAVAPERAASPTATVGTLSACGLVKRFGDLLAVDHADLEIGWGIHALLGENGAGKSTLVKTLYGYYRPDEGEVLVDGSPLVLRSPADARRAGVGLVFQQFTLIPALTVAENVALFLPDLGPVLNPDAIVERIRETSERYGLSVDPRRRVGTLSLPEQQRVEILRVLLAGARFLIFDEPTSVLPAQEIDALFATLRRLRDQGYPIVLITHKLHEVFDVADTVTVMRRGRVVGTEPIDRVDEDLLVEMMFGSTPDPVPRAAAGLAAETVVLALERVTSSGQGRPLRDLDVDVHAGEIVGIAGVAGNGQRELGDTIVGLARIEAGRRMLFGEDATTWPVARIRTAGVGFVPEAALARELVWNMTLAENIALGSPDRFTRHGGTDVDWKAIATEWTTTFAELDLDLPDLQTRAGTLSGGNAQRFAVARELARRPRLLVALYPTRGLDVPTATAVQRLVLAARDRGCGIVLVSQDLNELTSLSDRLLVMRDGVVVGALDPHITDAHEIGALMTGGTT